MTELYTMTRYLRNDLLQSADVANFDDWAAEFGEITSQLELKPAGDGYRMKKRFAKFQNLPELMCMFKEFADVQTADMLDLPAPKIKGGKPEIVVCDPSPYQLDYMKILAERSEKIQKGDVDPRVDNMLKITNEARLLGLDGRCIDINSEPYPDGKISRLADNLIKTYNETEKDKGTQIIFCDIAVNSDDGRFSAYEAVKEMLISKGIPEKEICFASDAKNDKQRDKMYEQLRNGEKRFIFASTTKLGTGANIQDRLAAVHHLDIPWRPSDVDQRNGRIIRQGNMFKEVDIFHYTTKGTFDSYMLNTLVTKQKFISQVLTSKTPARTCEDVDEMVLTYSEMQAVTSGNPLIKEKIELDNDVARLRLLESEHMQKKYYLQKLAEKTLPEKIHSLERSLEKVNKDTGSLNIPEVFSMRINGTVYDDRTKVNTALLQECLKSKAGNTRKEIGEYAGLKIVTSPETRISHDSFDLVLKGNSEYPFYIDLKGDFRNIVKVENVAKTHVSKKLVDLTERLEKSKADLQEALKQMNVPFEHAEELKVKTKRLETVNTELSKDDSSQVDVEGDRKTDEKKKYSKVSVSEKIKLENSGLDVSFKKSSDGYIVQYNSEDENIVNNLLNPKAMQR